MPTNINVVGSNPSQQAIHAIRGYEYQILAATLAWVNLDSNSELFLEVAEDYAKVVANILHAVQVKETKASGSVTLKTDSVRKAITSFVELTEKNPNHVVHLRFMTTSTIGKERARKDQPQGIEGLIYWKRVRTGLEDVAPLRNILVSDSFPQNVRDFCASRNDEQLCEQLISRITWDCGALDASNLQIEVQQRLAELRHQNYQITPAEIPRIVDSLFKRVLEKSALPNTADRILTRYELYEVLENVTRVSISRASLDSILKSKSDAGTTSQPFNSSVNIETQKFPSWFSDYSEFRIPKYRIPRTKIELKVDEMYRSHGVCWLYGSSGVGKSTVAQTLFLNRFKHLYCLDLRQTQPRETSERLHQTLSFLSMLETGGVIIEDLNTSEDHVVRTALGRVLEAANRHDFLVLVTSYKSPSAYLVNYLSLEMNCTFQCEYFEEQETETLIRTMGGDSNRWGKLIHRFGGYGHPQLVHAVVSQLASNNWFEGELDESLDQFFSSPEKNWEREATIENLISTLPEGARDLLYRLSLATQNFNRALMLQIGGVSPSISRAPEYFENLVGPWIERTNGDRYRPSPLVQGIGQNMLTSEDQRRVHHTIVEHIVENPPLSVSDLESALLHGLAGDAQTCLLTLSSYINLADQETRTSIANSLTVFRSLDLKRPIYKKHPHTSVLLRLAQLRLVASSSDQTTLNELVDSILHELKSTPSLKHDLDLEFLVVSSILNTYGLAKHLPYWISLLSRFRNLLQDNEDVTITVEDGREVFTTAVLFNMGIAELDSIETLETIFEDLNELTEDERTQILTPVDSKIADYKMMIRSPLTTESQQQDFDALSTAASYERLANRAKKWGNVKLSLQCFATAACVYHEHLKNDNKALRTLQKAAKTVSNSDPIIVLAFAEFYYHSGRYTEAFEYYQSVHKHIATGNPVAAIYTLRDAAICAANHNSLELAKSWFLQAQQFAAGQKGIELQAIEIGLGADAAVVCFELGEFAQTIKLLKESLDKLSVLDPHHNLQSAYCHRVVRHSIFRLKMQTEPDDNLVRGEQFDMLYGVCSNPNPLQEIWQHTLGHIDIAWYLLADLETITNCDVSGSTVLLKQMVQGQIPSLEFEHRLKIMESTIQKLDPINFCAHFAEFMAARVYFEDNAERLKGTLNSLDPVRETIPLIEFTVKTEQYLEPNAIQPIMAFGFMCLFLEKKERFFVLGETLAAKFGVCYPGREIFLTEDTTRWSCGDLEKRLGEILFSCFKSTVPHPTLLIYVGIYLLNWSQHSIFAPILMADLAHWLRREWRRVLREIPSHLLDQIQSADLMEEAFGGMDGKPFVAQMSLLACDALDIEIDQSLRELLSDTLRDSSP